MHSALSRPLRMTSSPAILRSFSTAASTMGAGDTGAPKPRGFLAEKDPFQSREAAAEGLYIKKQELEKIEALRHKLKEQGKHMAELDKHLEELSKNQGGEQN